MIFVSISFAKELKVEESWNMLLNDKIPVHATHHVNNILRNNAVPINLEKAELLSELGIKISGNNLIPVEPNYLQEYLESENFIFHYTTDQTSSDAVSTADINNNSIPDYIEMMGEIF